jgi:cysteine synthase B
MRRATTIDYQKERIEELAPYVGNTPLVEIKRMFKKPGVRIFAKLEWQQFGGSVKARPAYNIIREALKTGDLHAGKTLLDATSGNTGIAYSIFSAVAGIDLTLCVPENASRERKQIFDTLGVNIIYTDPFGTTDVAQEVARDLVSKNPDQYFYADQYSNDNNWLAHYNGTANEVWNQTRTKITHFVSGLGTTGTFTGTGTRLKELNEDIQLVALQPETALHGLEGWKHLETAKVPSIFAKNLPDEYRSVGTEGAYTVLKDAARYEGLLLSPSSAANLMGAMAVANELDEGVVVTVFPDDSAKYSDVLNQIYNN